MNGIIQHCIFKYISKNGNGGAIEVNVESVSIDILSCHFESICINQSGGSIYLTTSANSISSCYFDNTYSSAHSNDEITGNAIFIGKGESTLENSATFQCGKDTTFCTDSAVRINTVCTINSFNATANTGYRGASGFSITSAQNSIISYINIVDVLDSVAAEDYNLENEFSYINFINTSLAKNVIYLTANDVLTLRNCTFIDSCKILSTPSKKITIISCYADDEFDTYLGITITTNPKTIHFDINFKINRCIIISFYKKITLYSRLAFISILLL